MIHKVIKYLLENDSTFNTAIGDDDEGEVKIYPLLAPQTVTAPYCVYELNEMGPNPAKEEVSGADLNSFVVKVYDTEFDDVMDLADKARSALDKATAGTYNSVILLTMNFTGLNDGYVMEGEPLYYIELNFDAYIR